MPIVEIARKGVEREPLVLLCLGFGLLDLVGYDVLGTGRRCGRNKNSDGSNTKSNVFMAIFLFYEIYDISRFTLIIKLIFLNSNKTITTFFHYSNRCIVIAKST